MKYEYKGLSKTSECDILLEDSHEAWYWIGFLMADGHINKGKIELSLSEKDVNHIKRFARFIQYTKELKYLPKRGLGRAQFTINTSNQLVAKEIRKKFNFSHDKTYNPPNFDKINTNDDMFFCLFVGFVDGDGNIGDVKNRKCKYIRIRNHVSWINNMKFFDKFLFTYFQKQKSREYTKIECCKKGGRLGSCEQAYFRIARTDLLIAIRDKIKEFRLPVMQRKWDKLNSLAIEESNWTREEVSQLKVFKDNLIKTFRGRSWAGIKGKLYRI